MSLPPAQQPAPAHPPAQAQPYGQPVASGYPPQYPPTNALAIVSLVLSLVGVGIGAVIAGHIALGQIRRRREQGHGMAVAGLIVGYVGCAGWIVFWLFWLVSILIPLLLVGGLQMTPGGLQS